MALRLISDREAAIEVFQPREYWSLDASLETGAAVGFEATLTEVSPPPPPPLLHPLSTLRSQINMAVAGSWSIL